MKAIVAAGGVLLATAGAADAAIIFTSVSEIYGSTFATAGNERNYTPLVLNGDLYTASITSRYLGTGTVNYSFSSSSLRIGRDTGRIDFDITANGLGTQAAGSLFTTFRLSANNFGDQPVNLYLDTQLQGMSTSITWLGSSVVPNSSGVGLKFDNPLGGITFDSAKGEFTTSFPNQSGPTCENRFDNGNAERACFWGPQTARSLIGVLDPGYAYFLTATFATNLDIDVVDAMYRGYNATYSMTGLRFGFSAEALTVLPPPPVPEPASWVMLIAGFGMTGAAMRRGAVRMRLA